MKKKELIQWYCPECGSIHVQQLTWVDMNSANVDWDSGADLSKYYCRDCEITFSRIDTKVFKCFNGKPRIEGYQVVSADGTNEIHPEMDGSFCLYSLSQAKDMIKGSPKWQLLTCFKGDMEEPTLMYEGKDPRV